MDGGSSDHHREKPMSARSLSRTLFGLLMIAAISASFVGCVASESNVKDVRDDMDDRISNLAIEVDRLKQESRSTPRLDPAKTLAPIQEKIEANRASAETLDSRLRTLELQVESHSSDLGIANENLSSQAANLKALNTNIEAVNKNIETVNGKLGQLSSDLADVAARQVEGNLKLDTVGKSRDKVEASLEEIRGRQAELQVDLDDVQVQSRQRGGELEKEIVQLQRDLQELRKMLGEMDSRDTSGLERAQDETDRKLVKVGENVSKLGDRLSKVEAALLAMAKVRQSSAAGSAISVPSPAAPSVVAPVPAAPSTPTPSPTLTARSSEPVAPPKPTAVEEPVKAVTPRSDETADATEITDPNELYKTAMNLFREKRYKEARSLFSTFVGKYPNHPVADNAQFWVGETYFKEGSFEDSILEYQKVIQRYATGNKVPDALLKQAMAFQRLGDNTSARILYQKLEKDYAESPQAGTAMNELMKMK